MAEIALPPIMAEIADVIGMDAAWRLIREKGGQRIYVPADVNQGHWLALLIGLDKAKDLAEHFRGGSGGTLVTIPQARLYSSQQAMVKALSGGATANEAAAVSGMHVRSAYRARRRLRRPSLPDLFGEEE